MSYAGRYGGTEPVGQPTHREGGLRLHQIVVAVANMDTMERGSRLGHLPILPDAYPYSKMVLRQAITQ